MKGFILDGYGTLVKVARKRYPYRRIENHSSMSPHSFYGFILSHDVTHERMLEMYEIEEDLARKSIRKMELELASIEAFPEAKAFLQKLDERGIAWRIVSNLATPYCEPLLKALAIPNDKCFFSCEHGFIKPQHHAFNLAANSMKLAAQEIMVVGDSRRADIEGAKWAGMQSFHLQRPGHDLWCALDAFDGLVRRNLNAPQDSFEP